MISDITQIDKKTLTEKLALELPALRAKMGNSQADMGELIGVSRQTYSMIETQKKEMGWSAIIYLAAISGVDMQLYEACEIDGGGRLMKLLHITLPCIAGTITIMFILRMGSIMTVSFDKVFLMQNSNTYNTSDVISTFVYRRGLQGMQYSYATAVGLVESVISLFFLGITNFVSSKVSDTSLF